MLRFEAKARLDFGQIKGEVVGFGCSCVDETEVEAFGQPRDSLAPVNNCGPAQGKLLAYRLLFFDAQNQAAGDIAHIAKVLFMGNAIGVAAEKQLIFACPLGSEVVENGLRVGVTAFHRLVALVCAAEGEPHWHPSLVEEFTRFNDCGEAE